MSKIPKEVMKSSSFFSALAADDCSLMEKFMGEKQLRAGTTVFIENMPGESLYIILSGTVRISRMLAEGDERTLAVLGPGDVFGEMAIVESATRAATARVLEDVTLLSLTRESFEKLCEQHEVVGLKVMKNIMKTFSLRLRQNSDEYREMMLFALGDVE